MPRIPPDDLMPSALVLPPPKRVYKARKQLATIDWNFHINLPNAKSKSGAGCSKVD